MKLSLIASLAVLLPALAAPSKEIPCPIGKVVHTTSGAITGHAASNRTGVSEYLGIPFARPPVDELRFAAPQPYHSSAAFNASSFGKTCLTPVAPLNLSILAAEGYHLSPTADQFLSTNNEDGFTIGEDCLTLNVWTQPQKGQSAKAVLLYIYGGGFQGGYTASSLVSGEFIADEEDVIVVSANYRVNVFGFPGLQPAVAGVAANAGLLDQRLAVEWVRDNIAGFGGDPHRITLFGQSAGSASVSMYGYAYAHDPIVNGLITQSGTADSFGAAPPNSTAAFEAMCSLLGCNSSSTIPSPADLEKQVACVRSKSATEVLAASHQLPPTLQQSSLGIWAPTADGHTVFPDYAPMTAKAQFSKVPRLLGSNAQEGNYFQLLFALAGQRLPQVFWDFFTLVIFTCPTEEAASGFVQHGAQKTWRYVYDGDYPNTQITINPSLGAYHGAELRLLFGVSQIYGIADTPAEQATGKLMRSAWASFARDPVNGLSKSSLAWPSWSSGPAARVVELGLGNSTTASFQSTVTVDALCPVIMPGFKAIGGANALVKYAAVAAPLLQQLKGDNVTQVLEILQQVAHSV